MKIKERYYVNLLAHGLWTIFLIGITGPIIQLWEDVATEPQSSPLFVGDMIGAIIFTGIWFGFFWLLKLFPPYAISITPNKIHLDYVFRKRIIKCNQVRRIEHLNRGFFIHDHEVILKSGENIAIGMVSKKALEKIEECVEDIQRP